LDKEKSSIKNN